MIATRAPRSKIAKLPPSELIIMKTAHSCFSSLFVLFALMSHLRAEIVAGPIINPANQHAYYLLTADTWLKDEAEAESLGGTLAIIANADQQKWVFNTFNSYQGVNEIGLWIGLHRTKLSGPFAWVTGAPLTYTNWNQGEPNNVGGAENCVHMSSGVTWAPGTWNDLPDNTFDDRKFGVVEVNGKFDAKTFAKRQRALVGSWYEGGKADRACWIAATEDMLFVIQNNGLAAKGGMCVDGSLYVSEFPGGWRRGDVIFGGSMGQAPGSGNQRGMRGQLLEDKILWSNGTWWSRKLEK
jgi:hypothetical protein